jgi:predicted transposase/invertase (TIGR01784 family)
MLFYVHLELQSETDFTMPFRLLTYMTELLRRLFAETEEKVRARKDFRLPAVVPIVLYNGNDEWSCVKSFKEYLDSHELFVPNVIDFEYILININAPDEAALLEIPTLMNLAMLADRKGDPKRVLLRIGRVLELSSRLTRDERVQLGAWVFDVILRKAKGKLDADTIARIGKAFERKEETQMTYAIERAIDELEQRGIRKGRRAGKLEGKLETAMAMLANGLSLETAAKCSGIPADELRRISEKGKPQ